MDLDPRSQRQPASSPTRSPIPPDVVQQLPPGQTAAAFSRKKWGQLVVPVISRPTASTTAANVLGGNPKRVFWLIVNRGIADVNIDINATATAGNGILIAAGGGFVSMDVQEDAEAVTYNVSGIAASGTPQLWVYSIESL